MGNKQYQNFQWEDSFTVLERNFSDHTLILQKKQNKQEYLGREILSTDKKQSEQIKRLIKTKYHNNNPFLTKLAQVYYNNDEAYCSPQDKIYLVFEKPKQTLRQEILARKFANEPFTEEEADIILESGAKAIRSLKEIQHPHNNISTSSIFIDNDRRILVGDPWITPPAYNQEMTQNVFACPSPEKILLQNDQIMSICPYRSDLFSLGTVVLEALNYEHMDILYEKGFRKLLQPKLKQKLNKIKNQQLRYKLSVVLSHDPQNRDEIYTLYRTAGLTVSQAKNKIINKQGMMKKVNTVNKQFDKASPIVQLSKQILMQDNNKGNSQTLPLQNTQYISSQQQQQQQQQQINNNAYYNNIQPNQTNRISNPNNIKINNQPYSATAFPSNSNYYPTYTANKYNTTPTNYYNTNTNTNNTHTTYTNINANTANISANTTPYNPYSNNTSTPISFNNHNYQRINYMTHTNPNSHTNYLNILNDSKINMPTFSTIDNKLTNQTSHKIVDNTITSNANTNNTITHIDTSSNTNIINNNNNIPTTTTTVVSNQNNNSNSNELKHEQISSSIDNNLLPISIISSNDLVNTSGNIRYIESNEHEEPITVGNYNIKNNQPVTKPQNNNPTQNVQPISHPQPPPPINKQRKQAPTATSTQGTTKNNTQPHRQTPDKKPSRKYNSTIKQEADEYSYSGSRDGEEQYEYVVEEYEAGRYEGQKHNGMRNGFGKFYYKEGSVYEGHWRDNLMDGKGNLYYSNGKLAYEGDWRMDQFHGFGKVYNEDQYQLKGNYHYNDFSDINDFWASYQGELHSDRRHGKGKIKISNGQIFVGQFIADAVEGPGKFYTLGGEIVQGIWKNNKLIRKL